MKNGDPVSILKTDNATIPLTMGVTISAPDPRLPVENSLPFDPAKQKPENAFPEDRNFPNFPNPSPASTQWHPDEQQLVAEIASKLAAEIVPKIAARLGAEIVAKIAAGVTAKIAMKIAMKMAARVAAKIRWGRVSRKWRESKKNEETVRQWRDAFSWKAKLKAKAPERLINGFGELYMAPPMLTVG